jgi:Flp pilus assembly protein TadD
MSTLADQIEKWMTGARGILSILVLTLCAWLPTLHGEVMSVDSIWLIRDNPILNGSNETSAIDLIHTILFDLSLDTRLVLGAEYLPIRDLSVWLDLTLFGDNFAFHHLGNLLWYCLSVTGVFLLCERLLGEGKIPWITTALFALHPAHVESVAWLASRKDLLGFSLFIATLLYFLSDKHRGTLLKTILFIPALTLASIWSKNTSVILPGVLATTSVLFLPISLRNWRWWLSWVPLGLVVLGATALSTELGGRVGIYAEPRVTGILEVISLQGALFFHYFEKLLVPFGLVPFYTEPEILSFGAIGGLIISTVLITSAIRLRKRAPSFSLGVAILFIGLVPVSMLVPLQNLITDRYLLIPSLGFCLGLGALAQLAPIKFKGAVYGVYFGLLAIFGVQTHSQASLWQDEGDLWAHNIEVEPTVARGWTLLAKHYETNGDIDGAMSTISDALNVMPDHPGLLQYRGAVSLSLGNFESAERDLRLALSIEPNRRSAAHSLATVLMKTNRNQEAATVAEKLVETHPQYPEARNTYGAILLNIGDLDSSEEHLMIAELMMWKDANVACNLGSIGWLRAQESDADEAIIRGGHEMARTWWTKCLERDPGMDYATRGLEALSNLK